MTETTKGKPMYYCEYCNYKKTTHRVETIEGDWITCCMNCDMENRGLE